MHDEEYSASTKIVDKKELDKAKPMSCETAEKYAQANQDQPTSTTVVSQRSCELSALFQSQIKLQREIPVGLFAKSTINSEVRYLCLWPSLLSSSFEFYDTNSKLSHWLFNNTRSIPTSKMTLSINHGLRQQLVHFQHIQPRRLPHGGGKTPTRDRDKVEPGARVPRKQQMRVPKGNKEEKVVAQRKEPKVMLNEERNTQRKAQRKEPTLMLNEERITQRQVQR